MVFNKVYYMNLIVWLILGNLFSLSLVENQYQKTVIPSIIESYENQISFLKKELYTEKISKSEEKPEKIVCYSRTEILKLVVNKTYAREDKHRLEPIIKDVGVGGINDKEE